MYSSTSYFFSENSDAGDFFNILNNDKSGHNLTLANFVAGLDNEKIVEMIKNKNINKTFTHPKKIQNFCE